MKVSEAMLSAYVYIDDFLKARPGLTLWRESPNDEPAFFDAEVLTLAQTYRLVREEYAGCFPRLVGYKQLVRGLNQIGELCGALFEQVASRLAVDRRYLLAGSKPIPLSKTIRHGRVRLLREEGAAIGTFFRAGRRRRPQS